MFLFVCLSCLKFPPKFSITVCLARHPLPLNAYFPRRFVSPKKGHITRATSLELKERKSWKTRLRLSRLITSMEKWRNLLPVNILFTASPRSSGSSRMENSLTMQKWIKTQLWDNQGVRLSSFFFSVPRHFFLFFLSCSFSFPFSFLSFPFFS